MTEPSLFGGATLTADALTDYASPLPGSGALTADADLPHLKHLLSLEDPDWQEFRSDDPRWFLEAAGAVIRKYVGWHIYPNIQTTATNLRVGTKAIVMLPSHHVTSVDELNIWFGEQNGDPKVLDPSAYIWYPSGWIQIKGTQWWSDWYMTGYYYGNDPYYLPVTRPGIATCTFHHGYHELPDDVKAVAFELADQAITVRAGNVKVLQSPGGYRADPTQPFGLTLNLDQKNRLANYRIGMVG